MDVPKYLTEMRKIQGLLLNYFEKGEEFDDLIFLIKDQFQRNQKEEIKETLKLIIEIVNNHLRSSDFYTKIVKLLSNFSLEIKQTFSNFELFDLFKSSKIILLFLIKNSLLSFDQSICEVMNDYEYWNGNYYKYFLPEIQPFISIALYKEIENDILKDGLQEFEDRRQVGENELYICHLIRNDLIDDFITLINKTNLSLSTVISPSIFETNDFLMKNKPSLIEYSAFYGSLQIFKFLLLNNVELSPALWIYTIHGKNPELIHILEENHVIPKDKTFNECLTESIKFFSNDIANYIIDNLIEISNVDHVFPLNFIYHNYEFIPIDGLEKILYYSCKYNYIYLVSLLLKTADININKLIVLIMFFLNKDNEILKYY